ncbi:unnamed protein product [Haemonchus placei]|uniref:SWIM-type domain-containing protein n=1 Tax=Haemonchus placei TaxID=6290 RepID=A0A0N4VSF0_HAEPC|nr:unnamed protein product [Haemonchus placei]
MMIPFEKQVQFRKDTVNGAYKIAEGTHLEINVGMHRFVCDFRHGCGRRDLRDRCNSRICTHIVKEEEKICRKEILGGPA